LTTYEEVIEKMKELKTIASHITAMGKLMNKTEDDRLRSLIADAITALQSALVPPPRVKGQPAPRSAKGIPGNLMNATDRRIQAVRQYCEQRIQAKEPEWMVMARRHGWNPPQQA
jgi:hypothetical protein